MKRLLIAATLSTALSACSSFGHVDYECHLQDVQAAKCASMEDAYKASKTYKRDGHSQSVFESGTGSTQDDAKRPVSAEAPFFRGNDSNFPDAAQQGMPVFKQPKVMRVWVAPYVDADGNLRSGEYTYFATPGEWNYGSLNKPGAASGMFEPTRPGQLGFTPRDVKAAAQSPAKPPETTQGFKPTIPAAASPAAEGTQGAMAPSSAQGGITQPYQRLGN